jgi:hypothetical protein
MNLDYFNKIDHLLNEEMSQSRVLKIINRQRGQTEDIVKKLSRNNFVNIVYRIVSRGIDFNLIFRTPGNTEAFQPRASQEVPGLGAREHDGGTAG